MNILAPTAAKRCPEWDTLTTVLISWEMFKYGCFEECENVSNDKLALLLWINLLLVWETKPDFIPKLDGLFLVGDSILNLSSYVLILEGEPFLNILWVVFLFKFLKILFILLTSSLFSSTWFFKSLSRSIVRYTIVSKVVNSPSFPYSPNYLFTKLINLCILL